MNFVPYRSKEKLRQTGLDDLAELEGLSLTIPSIKPKDARHLVVHQIHSPGTWIVDYLFIRPNGELLEWDVPDNAVDDSTVNESGMSMYRGRRIMIICCFIHCNSRFVDFDVVTSKSKGEFVGALRNLVSKYPGKLTTLISDAESSFSSDVANLFYKQNNNIRHIIYSMSGKRSTSHRRLALIDRFARTLRDMIFNSHRSNPQFRLTYDTLKTIISLYNSTPHSTLSHLMGFLVCPYDAFRHKDLEDELIRRLQAQNYRTQNSYKWSQIEVGDEVFLHKPRKFGEKRRVNVEEDPYTVTSIKPGGFTLQNTDGNELTEEFMEYVPSKSTYKAHKITRIVPRSELAKAS